MGYIALAVGHLLPRVMTKKNVPRYISRSVPAAGRGTRVIVILFWREINPARRLLCNQSFFLSATTQLTFHKSIDIHTAKRIDLRLTRPLDNKTIISTNIHRRHDIPPANHAIDILRTML
jgi:hypothetical protein